MSGLRVLALGVGDAFSARYYSSCFAVHAEGTWLLIDCPHPIRKILHEASAAAGVALDVGDMHAVVLTHLHADHASGLEGFGYYSTFLLRRPAALVLHPDVAKRLWDGHLAAGMEWHLAVGATAPTSRGLDDYFRLVMMDETHPAQVGPFSISCRKTIHPVPTTALKIEAAGRCLAYSADTAYDPTLIDWLSAGDRIIHETNFSIHTPYEKLAALPEPIRRKMLLTHYADSFDPDASIIEPLRSGRIYEV